MRQSGTAQRYHILDLVRGIALLNMLAFHTLYDLVYLFGVDIPWYVSQAGYVWQQFICWTFILIAGMSFALSKRPVRHGLIVFGCGLLLSIGSYVAMPEQFVVFGILHFMGLAMLLLTAVQKVLRRIPAPLGAAGFFALFLFTKGLAGGFLGIGDTPLLALPDWLYGTSFLFPLGLPSSAFSSSDYFPLLPWFFLLVTGWYLWRLLENRRWFSQIAHWELPLINVAGRHTLVVYMLHQPVIYAVCYLMFRVFFAG